MKSFEYVALDRSHSLVKGRCVLPTEAEAVAFLTQQNLRPVSITETSGSIAGWFHVLSQTQGRLDRKQLSVLIDQISTLHASGIPLNDVLLALSPAVESGRVRALLAHWMRALSEGLRFADAIAENRAYIPDAEQVISAIRSGEESGCLEETMQQLAETLATQADNQSRVRNALIYPTLLVSTAIAAVIYLMVAVIPDLISVFIHRQTALPWTTQTVIAISGFLVNYWLVLAGLLCGCVMLWLLAQRVPGVRFVRDRWLLQVPIVGRWLLYDELIRWVSSLSLLLGAHVPVARALTVANRSFANLGLAKDMEAVRLHVLEGQALSDGLQRVSCLPELIRISVRSAETANQLSATFGKLGHYYRKELNQQIHTFIELINPVLLILIALVIMFIMLSILTPILDMNQLVSL